MKKQLLMVTLLSLSGNLVAKKAPQTEEKPLSVEILSEHGQTWAGQMTQKLDQEELALLANYLYFNFLTTRCDHMLRVGLYLCQTNLPKVSFLVDSNEGETYKTIDTICQHMGSLKENIIPIRANAIKAAQACFEHIEDSEYTQLKKVIAKFQMYSKSAVNQFIHQDWEKNIIKIISSCANTIKQESEKLTPYHADLNKIASLEISEEREEDALCAAQFQDALKIAESSYASCLNLLGNSLSVISMSSDISNIAAIINQIFYNHLLETLKSKKIGSIAIMFDENGLIEEEDRSDKLLVIGEKFAIGKKQR